MSEWKGALGWGVRGVKHVHRVFFCELFIKSEKMRGYCWA